MIPAPSRNPIPHPIAAASLASFTHPRCPVLGKVVRHPGTKAAMVANGCIALRITRGPIEFDDQIPPACGKFVARIDALPWARFAPDSKRMTPVEWRGFDDIRGNLYTYGLEELWTDEGAMTKAKPVWTAKSILIPLAILQLVARLPRVELRMDGNPDFALIRFSGGEGVIANRYRTVRPADIPAHIFSIFHGPASALPGGFTTP